MFLENLKKVKLYWLVLRTITLTDMSFEEGIFSVLCTMLHRNFVAWFWKTAIFFVVFLIFSTQMNSQSEKLKLWTENWLLNQFFFLLSPSVSLASNFLLLCLYVKSVSYAYEYLICNRLPVDADICNKMCYLHSCRTLWIKFSSFSKSMPVCLCRKKTLNRSCSCTT